MSKQQRSRTTKKFADWFQRAARANMSFYLTCIKSREPCTVGKPVPGQKLNVVRLIPTMRCPPDQRLLFTSKIDAQNFAIVCGLRSYEVRPIADNPVAPMPGQQGASER